MRADGKQLARHMLTRLSVRLRALRNCATEEREYSKTTNSENENDETTKLLQMVLTSTIDYDADWKSICREKRFKIISLKDRSEFTPEAGR